MNELKLFIKRIFRYLVMKKLTGNLGKVVEKEDRIICYVNKLNLKKVNYEYVICCRGINDSNKELAKNYKLNKPITYIFNNIEFNKNEVTIYGYDDSDIIIKDCKFERDLLIANPEGKTVLDNTFLKQFLNLMISSSDLVFKNMNIKNHYYGLKLNILMNANNIEMINSNIGEAFEKTSINIDVKNKFNIVNSKISGETVELKSQELVSDDSLILATEIILIDTNKSNELNLKAPSILTNDNTLLNAKDNINEKTEETNENAKRMEILKILRNIKTQCEFINNSKVEEYKSDLNKKEISKILRK